MPFAVIGSETELNVSGKTVIGREYLWGVAEGIWMKNLKKLVENPEHCDYKALRNLLVRTHMHDLITATKETHYENFRSSKMSSGDYTPPNDTSSKLNLQAKLKEDEDSLRKRFAEQVRLEETRFRHWEQKVLILF